MHIEIKTKVLGRHQSSVFTVCLDASGHYAASGSSDMTVRVWHVSAPTTRALSILRGHTEAVTSVAFRPSVPSVPNAPNVPGVANIVGTGDFTLVSGAVDGTVKLWSVATGSCVGSLVHHSTRYTTVWAVAFSPDARTLASGHDDPSHSILLWDTLTHAHTHKLLGHAMFVTSITFGCRGDTLVSGSADSTARVWGLERARVWQCHATLHGHYSSVTSVAVDARCRYIATADAAQVGGKVKLWSVADHCKCIATFAEHSDRVWSVAFTESGEYIASASDDKTIRVYSTYSQACICVLRGHTQGVWAVAFGGKHLVSGAHDNTVRRWDTGLLTQAAWHTLRHDLHVEHLQECVTTILHLAVRLEAQQETQQSTRKQRANERRKETAATDSDAHGVRASTADVDTPPSLPAFLPPELWFKILSYLCNSDFPARAGTKH